MKALARKRYVIRIIAVNLLFLWFINFAFTKNRNAFDGEVPSAIRSALFQFEDVSKPSRRPVEDHNNLFGRDFSRVPGYLGGASNSPPLFGYVMRDLSNRFLMPSSPQQKRRRLLEGQSSSSNILVVCPGANALLSEIKKKNTATIASRKELIKSFGYRIGESFLVDGVFNFHNVIAVDSNTGILDDHGSNTNNIMLAIFDPEQGQEDNVISRPLEKYIRSGIIQFATFRISGSLLSNTFVEDRASMSEKTEMRGIETSKLFLDAGYKLQVLSSSHAPRDGLNPYGPNTLLKNVEDVEGFLRFGVGLSQNAQDIRSSKKSSKNSTSSSKMSHLPIAFHSILFATRSLDLAIPTRKAFLNLTSYDNSHVLDVQKDGVPYLNCSRSSSLAPTLRFADDLDSSHDEYASNGDKFEISCFGKKILMHGTHAKRIEDGNGVMFVELWHSHINISLSEAACLKCTHHGNQNVSESVCTNRILPRKKSSLALSSQRRINNGGPNLLAIELRGVNQRMLNSSLTRFKALSENLGLEYFSNVVPSATIPNGRIDQNWWAFWDSIGVDEDGYQRYHGSNQCDLSFHSSDNNSTLYHGSQIGGMFCFDYDRPNCLGKKHAATYLLDHVKSFVKMNRNNKERWASYITLVDGVEETETLVGTLDLPLTDFLSDFIAEMTSEEWSNTVITIFSNDVQDPILLLKDNNSNKARLLKERSTLFTLDLHQTMRSIITNTDARIESHTDPVPDLTNTRAQTDKAGSHDEFRFDKVGPVVPPSILSFYADIPKEHKFQLVKPYSERPTKRAMVFQGCWCATKVLPWSKCDQHPWNEQQDQVDTYALVDCPGQPLHLEINLIQNKKLVSRSNRKRKESASSVLNKVNIMFLELDSVSQEYADRHFPKTRELLKKYRIKQNDNDKYECVHGICSAEFPYTALVGANSIPNQVAALSGCITSSASGQDLCGLVDPEVGDICNDVDMTHHGFRLERIRKVGDTAYWCPQRDLNVTRTPWLLGVSDSKGYINFFGEEFCYDHSPYVTQGNVFAKFYQDIQSHFVFCSLVDRKVRKEYLLVPMKHRWGVEMNDPCIEGNTCSKIAEKSTISLQFMEQVWNVYSSVPKFAFLNAMAAHDYSPDWEMIIPKAEAYDGHIHTFLKTMLSRRDSESTVIIIRSDHGLQKGPMSMDYSIQVEHRHPWTEILVPQNLVVSKRALYNNQERMLTGFDLYRTMRFLLPGKTANRNLGEGIPDWAFNILAEEISQNRTCKEAKVDPTLCPSVKQTRQYGVCNSLDSSQAHFC